MSTVGLSSDVKVQVQNAMGLAIGSKESSLVELVPELEEFKLLPLRAISPAPPPIGAWATRSRRFLESLKLELIGDLSSLSVLELMEKPGVGLHTVRGLLKTLFSVVFMFSPDDLETHLRNRAEEDAASVSGALRLSERDEKIIELRNAGFTLDAIGEEVLLTRERVRQILVQIGGPTASELRARASNERKLRITAEAREVRREVVLNPGSTIQEIATRCSLSPSTVKSHVPTHLKKLVLEHQKASYSQQWTDEEIFVALQNAQTFEFPLTTSGYTDLLRLGEISGPTVPRLSQRFGSWIRACKMAGVEYRDAHRSYSSNWTDDDLVRFVCAYFSEHETDGTFRGYEKWSEAAGADVPSGGTVRNRLGPWAFVKELIFSGPFQEFQASLPLADRLKIEEDHE